MSKFSENLWSDLTREHGATLAHTEAPGTSRRPRRRVLAGSTLGLAGAGAGLVLALSGTAAAPAFAVTQSSDGSVQVQVNQFQSIVDANQKLASMGLNEQVTIYNAPGAAPTGGPVSCTGGTTPVQVLMGTDGTTTIAPGTTGGNTGVGTWHIARCVVSTGISATGNSGSGS